jgi:S-formylglutathione hydrolase FrmB
MALFHAKFFSETLGLCCAADVILPQPMKAPCKTLWLLHGMSDDHTIWQRRTSIERYVEGLPLAVVMPAAHRSRYTDMARGYRYWTYISEELPALCRSFFPLSGAREDNYVAGLSMGGYGAMKLGLRRPDAYAAAASLSGSLDLVSRVATAEGEGKAELENVHGDLNAVRGSHADLFAAASDLVTSGAPRPRLFAWCGTEDFLYESNQAFRAHCQSIGLALDYSEGPGGHTWDKWDVQIRCVLAWLGLERGS